MPDNADDLARQALLELADIAAVELEHAGQRRTDVAIARCLGMTAQNWHNTKRGRRGVAWSTVLTALRAFNEGADVPVAVWTDGRVVTVSR